MERVAELAGSVWITMHRSPSGDGFGPFGAIATDRNQGAPCIGMVCASAPAAIAVSP